MAQHRPLYSSGFTPQSRTYRELMIPQEAEKIPAAASEVPWGCRPPVRGALGGQTQAATIGAAPPGMDIVGDRVSHRQQDIGTPEWG